MNSTSIKIRKSIHKKIKEWIYITIGVALIAFAFSFFLEPKNIVIGGVSGVGVIVNVLKAGLNPALIILAINIILLLFGLLLLGKDFFIKTVYGSLAYPFFIFIFEIILNQFNIYQILNELDMFIIIIFSSVIMGIGIGIVVKYGGTTGGTEVLQKIFFKFFHI